MDLGGSFVRLFSVGDQISDFMSSFHSMWKLQKKGSWSLSTSWPEKLKSLFNIICLFRDWIASSEPICKKQMLIFYNVIENQFERHPSILSNATFRPLYLQCKFEKRWSWAFPKLPFTWMSKITVLLYMNIIRSNLELMRISKKSSGLQINSPN